MTTATTTWAQNASCAQADPDMFFPVDLNQHTYAPALAVCASCPVIAECRAYADAFEGKTRPQSLYGVWGGETPNGRYTRRRKESA
ncbi:MAG: WhiB family transcriptional regulator [Actinomycetaceae bacterium]|nr:WhiB family transcriptional regulator [Actinomycetaceae bacterium]